MVRVENKRVRSLFLSLGFQDRGMDDLSHNLITFKFLRYHSRPRSHNRSLGRFGRRNTNAPTHHRNMGISVTFLHQNKRYNETTHSLSPTLEDDDFVIEKFFVACFLLVKGYNTFTCWRVLTSSKQI